MKEEFTMAEYIAENKLGVSVHDAGSTKVIAEFLRKKGYSMRRKRVHGVVSNVWSKNHGKNDLRERLKGLK